MRTSRPIISEKTKYVFPEPCHIAKSVTFQDDFKRESLQPTNAYTYYTVAVTGTGTGIISSGDNLVLTTSATIGHDVDVRVSGMLFNRLAEFIDDKTQIEIDIIFNSATITNAEGFIGLYGGNTGAIVALPNGADWFFGLRYDQSVNANYRLVTGDGVSEVNTDTAIAIAGGKRRLNILWSSDSIVKLSLFSGTTFSTLDKTVSSTSLDSDVQPYTLHFFIQTEAAAGKQLTIDAWKVQVR